MDGIRNGTIRSNLSDVKITEEQWNNIFKRKSAEVSEGQGHGTTEQGRDGNAQDFARKIEN